MGFDFLRCPCHNHCIVATVATATTIVATVVHVATTTTAVIAATAAILAATAAIAPTVAATVVATALLDAAASTLGGIVAVAVEAGWCQMPGRASEAVLGLPRCWRSSIGWILGWRHRLYQRLTPHP